MFTHPRSHASRKIHSGFAVVIVILLTICSSLQAQVPNLVHYQGRVLVGSTNFTGSGQFKFALVDTTGANTFWNNDGTSSTGSQPTNAVSLTVTNGLYSVLLGDTTLAHMTVLPASVFTNADLRLRVWFNDGSHGFQLLTPDQRLAPSGYLPDGVVTSAKIGVGAIGSAQLAPGVVIPPAVVSGTSQAAAANTNYLATNAALTTFTLPTTANVGDTIQVSGAGAGGWAVSAPWVQRASHQAWTFVASSADGSKLIAGSKYDLLYTSTDFGATWTPRATTNPWSYAASSADGTKLVAVQRPGQIYTSTDSGVTWTPRDSSRNWTSVASSSDGAKLVAAVDSGQIYTSADSGVTWTPHDSNRGWLGVASSADGTKLVAGVYNGQIYTSTDSGVTWTPRDSNRTWAYFASSADGTKLVAGTNAGGIYTSADSGQTWTPQPAASAAAGSLVLWIGEACSSDGSKIFAAVNGGLIYASTDFGVTWASRSSKSTYWTGIACSADGGQLVATATDYIYTSDGNTYGSLGSTATMQYLGNGVWGVQSAAGGTQVSSTVSNSLWTSDGSGNVYRPSGNVGIGTVTPTQALLVVSGGVNGSINPNYGYLNTSGANFSNIPSGTKPFSIWATARIAATEINAFSDERIKDIVGVSDGAADLRTLMKLRITNYTYKDKIAKGDTPQKKVIAQQVEKIFPQAVRQTTDVVPDIFQKASLKDGWVWLKTDLKAGERVRLIGDKASGIYEVREIRDGAFRTDLQTEGTEVFVYGREVNDFRVVDYDALSMLSLSATQQLKKEKDTEIGALKREIEELKAKDKEREARLVKLEQFIPAAPKGNTVAASAQ